MHFCQHVVTSCLIFPVLFLSPTLIVDDRKYLCSYLIGFISSSKVQYLVKHSKMLDILLSNCVLFSSNPSCVFTSTATLLHWIFRCLFIYLRYFDTKESYEMQFMNTKKNIPRFSNTRKHLNIYSSFLNAS